MEKIDKSTDRKTNPVDHCFNITTRAGTGVNEEKKTHLFNSGYIEEQQLLQSQLHFAFKTNDVGDFKIKG